MRNREAKAERGPADKRQRSTGQLALGQFFSVEIQASPNAAHLASPFREERCFRG